MKLIGSVATIALSCAAVFVAAEADGVTLNVDQVKQRYPWNGLVDIDYTLTDAATLGVDDNLAVLMLDRSVTPAVTNRAVRFLQVPLPKTEGKHRITWDANGDGVTNRIKQAEFHIQIVHYAASYMVIDVSTGSGDDAVYEVDYLNGAPANNFNEDTYKGDKIVLRRIHRGSYVAGSPSDENARKGDGRETQHPVTLSRPCYIGVFEFTQQQYFNVMGEKPSLHKGDGDVWKFRPVENVSYNAVRGGHWPDPSDPGPCVEGFIGKLLAKCRAKGESGQYDAPVAGFDLPTDFQWEYACRAGTTKAFNLSDNFRNNNATDQLAEAKKAGCTAESRSTDEQTKDAHTYVGSYAPNAWGLYDMHGNVWEHCLDWMKYDAAGLKQSVDPKGPATQPETDPWRLRRGGCWYDTYTSARSAFRSAAKPHESSECNGFRLVRNLP